MSSSPSEMAPLRRADLDADLPALAACFACFAALAAAAFSALESGFAGADDGDAGDAPEDDGGGAFFGAIASRRGEARRRGAQRVTLREKRAAALGSSASGRP
jgi:hypothetical protein